MKSMYIGSGDINALMAGKTTKMHKKLLQRFVSDELPYYNALASPIDALRTGAILEDRYFELLSDCYYSQVKAQSNEMDVFKCSLDFARMEKGDITDFDELKTCSFTDFLNLEPFREDKNSGIEYIKKKYKSYYRQVQQQLYCTGLNECNIVFLVVYNYDDYENMTRKVKENEYIKFRIKRDKDVIESIKERGKIFQQIKDYYKQTLKTN